MTGSRGGAHLVVGDGKIGSALTAALRAEGTVVVTANRTGRGSARIVDLAAPPQRWHLPDRVAVAYVCAGVTSQDACRADPEHAWRINVAATALLAERLVAAGAFVVYPSTNLVFDGTVPWRRSDEQPCPMTCYGRTKSAAEERLLRWPNDTAIVRLTKVVPPSAGLLAAWARQLRAREGVEAFTDLAFAPIPLSFAVDAIRVVADRRLTGITQVSATRDISYAAAAAWIAAAVGAPPHLVHGASARGAGLEHVPLHTTLDASRLRATWPREAPAPEESLCLAIRD